MNSNPISVLKQEREILEEILALAQCQPQLLISGRAEDLEILLALRAGPLSKLAAAEEAVQAGMTNQFCTTTEELNELNELNLSILSLVDRIVDLDEKTEWLAAQSGDCATID